MQTSFKELNMRNAICAVALLAVAAAPAVADARGKSYKEATFKATLSGSQVSTYEEHRPNDKDGSSRSPSARRRGASRTST
jgi:hypothetical protein